MRHQDTNRSGAIQTPHRGLRRDRGTKIRWLVGRRATAGMVAFLAVLYWPSLPETRAQLTAAPPGEAAKFTDARGQAEEFMSYYRAISLTREQQTVMDEALRPVRAPCCSQNSMAACCCPCNLAKSVWGLSKFLIAQHGYGSAQVRSAVEGWIRFVNPAGFSGDACFTQGCNRPFGKNGCGGMNDRSLR